MKQLLSILGVSLLILLAVGGGCGFSAYTVVTGILNDRVSTSHLALSTFKWCFNGLPFVDKLPQILDHKNYVVLLQNNAELRPSGGFMGSYAVLSTTSSGLNAIKIQDIYVPDGQLMGHVDPPPPIEQSFAQGWWKLRDANWDPDFRVAGEQVAWFFDQGGQPADGLVAVNLSLLTGWLEIIGPVKPLDYSETVTSANLAILGQKYAEVAAFPGSTQKTDFLGAVGRAVLQKTQQTGPILKLKLAKLVWQQLKTKQILLWFKDADLEKTVSARNWDGALGDPTGNYLYIVETNLGANKANCCISRSVNQDVTVNSNSNSEVLTITWKNDNQFANPIKPYFWGGDYVDYVRVIIPAAAVISNVVVNNKQLVNKPLFNQYGIQEDRYQIENRDKFKIVGFWAKVPAQQAILATMNYQLPTTNSILIKRQPGIDNFDYQLIINGKNMFSGKIDSDREFGSL